jgi:hypothetical protein
MSGFPSFHALQRRLANAQPTATLEEVIAKFDEEHRQIQQKSIFSIKLSSLTITAILS